MRVVRVLVVAPLVVSTALAVSMTGALAAPAAPDACTLLAPRDVQGVFGGTVGDGTLTSTPDSSQSSCDWIWYPKPNHGNGVLLEVFAGKSAKSFTQLRHMVAGRTHTVKHLGDAAFSYRAVVSKHVFDELWTHRGTTAFRLSVLKDIGAKPLIKLATIVLQKLTPA